MIDRLQDVLPYLEQLPPEVQEEAATYLESLAEAFKHESIAPERIQHEVQSLERWEDPAGAWRDLPDDMLEELDKLRHAAPPTPPIELL